VGATSVDQALQEAGFGLHKSPVPTPRPLDKHFDDTPNLLHASHLLPQRLVHNPLAPFDEKGLRLLGEVAQNGDFLKVVCGTNVRELDLKNRS